MGERNWFERYKYARTYADEQAAAYERGDEVKGWRQVDERGMDNRREPLIGAAWVAWAYEIAAGNARSLVHVHGESWSFYIDECNRLAQKYQEKASAAHD